MDRDFSEPQPYDPAHSDAPHLPASKSGFVLVVAASGAGDRDWAERAATSLAAGWARQGRRVLLADLSLVHPGLHRVLGVPNREGVSDAFLFGSSIQKVAQPVRDRGFLFVPAGTATARPDAVTGSARWSAVIEGCARVQATLVAFLPSDLPGGETLLGHATQVVLLTDRNASGSAALQEGLGDRLRAVLMPPTPEAVAADGAWNGAPAAAAAQPATESWREAAPADVSSASASIPALPEPATAAEEPLPMFGFQEPEPAPAAEASEPPLPIIPVEEPLPPFRAAEPAPFAAAEEATLPLPVEEPAPSLAAEEPPTPLEEPAPSFTAEEPPPFSTEETAPFSTEESAPSLAADAPTPSFTAAEPSPSLGAPAASSGADEADGFTIAEPDTSFSIGESAAPPAEKAPPAAAEPAAAAFDMGSFGEIEVAEPAPAAAALSGFDDGLPAIPEPRADTEGMDLDLGALPEGGAPIEEVPTFSGELAFLEPEAPAAGGAAPAPVAGSSWAPPGAAAGAPAGMAPGAGSDLRANDIPMREEQPRERARPTRPVSAPRPEATPQPATSRAGAWALLALLVLAGVVGAAWYGLVDVPWLSDRLASVSPSATAPAQAAAATAAADAAESRANAYALTIESFSDPAVARIQAGSLNEQRPDLLFVIAPVQGNGRVLHRLLAGPAADSAGAEALRATLATVLTRERPASWVVRSTALAFNMGDREDLASAAERVAELSRVDIPAYVLELPGRNAAGARVPRYRVYSGAYANEQEAVYLRNLLVTKGFPDARLVQRIGRHPQ